MRQKWLNYAYASNTGSRQKTTVGVSEESWRIHWHEHLALCYSILRLWYYTTSQYMIGSNWGISCWQLAYHLQNACWIYSVYYADNDIDMTAISTWLLVVKQTHVNGGVWTRGCQPPWVVFVVRSIKLCLCSLPIAGAHQVIPTRDHVSSVDGEIQTWLLCY